MTFEETVVHITAWLATGYLAHKNTSGWQKAVMVAIVSVYSLELSGWLARIGML